MWVSCDSLARRRGAVEAYPVLSSGMPRPERASRGDLDAVMAHLQRFPVPWHLCGGWAIDAYLGRETREHSDIEIGIARDDQHRIHAYFPDAEIYKIVDHQILPWPGERIDLPWHQIIVRQPGLHEFEFFLNEIEHDLWRWRRRPSLTIPAERVYRVSSWGVNVVAPEVQLLFKARYKRPKDEQDLQVALPHLSPEGMSWLRRVLETYQPGDTWIQQLRPAHPWVRGVPQHR